MEVTTLLLLSGISAFLSLLFSQLFIYRKYRDSKSILSSKISEAEEQLREDINRFDVTELQRTLPGRELLSLLANSNDQVSDNVRSLDKNKNRPNVKSRGSLEFIANPTVTAIAVVSVLLLGILIGSRSYLLGSSLSAAEAEKIAVATKYQRQLAELQEEMAQAQTQSQIEILRQREEFLRIQYESETRIVDEKIQIHQSSMSAAILLTSIFGLSATAISVIWSGVKVLAYSPKKKGSKHYVQLTDAEIREIINIRRQRMKPPPE